MQLPRHILIVEDELEMLMCLRSYFTDRGHQVMTASTVEEALGCLKDATPDMAFIDLHLAEGNGRSVIHAITKQRLPTRMIVMTGSSDLEVRRELLACGVTDYLFKPISLREVGQLLKGPLNGDASDPSMSSDATHTRDGSSL